MAHILLLLIVSASLATSSTLSGLSNELLGEGLIWLDADGTPVTMCMKSLVNGTTVPETCTMTEGFGARSVGCFAVWMGEKLMQQGCYSGQELSLRDQCKRGKCVAGEATGAVSFCCCHGALCNVDHS